VTDVLRLERWVIGPAGLDPAYGLRASGEFEMPAAVVAPPGVSVYIGPRVPILLLESTPSMTGDWAQSARCLPPEAIRNIRRRYGRIRWLAYALLALVVLDFLSGKADVGLAALKTALALVICAGAWLCSRRALHLARFGEIVDGRIIAIHAYPVLRKLVGIHGLVDVVIEYQFQNEVFRWKKSVHKAFNPQVGALVQVVIDQRSPRRRMLLFDLWSRLAKS
jgi:hypothetical protein